MKLYLLGIVCLFALAAIPRADNDVDHDDTESDLTVEEGLRDETIASKTDDEVVQREDEAIKLDGLSVAEMKDLKESAEKHNYQAEVNRMMKLIINSLYRNKEIFLRELISNASDALDKIRFMSLTDPNVLSETTDLKVLIKPDKENHALHIIDTGIGMTREDLVKNLGTIAKSGTSEFLAKMEEGDETAVSSDLIGQFGVGFYSSFLVADTVVVTSKHNDDEQYIWESDAGSFSVAKDPRGNTLGRGTQISLFMKEEAYDFLEEHTIKDLVKKYSQFINFPIHLWTSKTEKVEEPIEEEEPAEEKTEEEGETDDDVKVEDEDDEKPKVKMVDKTVYDWEAMNDNKPIWLRNPKDVPDEDYQAFYKSFSKGSDDSLAHVHFTAEGEVTFRSILFVPKTAPYDLYQDYGKKVDNIKMYVKRVFITDDFEEMMPKYLNFVKGVVDSDDLPLNVSRETLQQNKLLRVIKKKLVRKALDMLKKMTDEDYEKFYKEFATNIKLGVMEDHSNRNRLAKLLRWQSSNAEGGELTSLTSYLERMKEKQEHIYFMTGTSRKECEMSPFVEKLLKKGYEVLYLVDPIDEYTVQNLPEFEGKKFQNAAKENLNLQDSEKAKETMESLGKDYDTLLNWLKEKVLSDGLDKAILSTRLVESPSALVASQYGYSGNMERIMKSQAYAKSGGNFHEQKKIMELNPFHPLVKKLLALYREDEESEEAKNLAHALYDTALLRSGYSLKDTTAFSARMDKLLRTSYSIGADEKVEIPEEFDQPDEEEPKEEEAEEDAEEAAEEVEDEEPAEDAEPPKDEL